MALHVRIETPIAPEIRWAWSLFCRDFGLEFREVEQGEELLISENDEADVLLSSDFRKLYQKEIYDQQKIMLSDFGVFNHRNQLDILSTVFYLVNGIQEYGAKAEDKYGRFPYEASLQYRFRIIQENKVRELFSRLGEQLGIEAKSDSLHLSESRLFLSHDIDRIYHGIREDALGEIKRGVKNQDLSKIAGGISQAGKEIKKPSWSNIAEIIKLHESHNCKSNYFWLVRYGPQEDPPQADYRIDSNLVQKQISRIKSSQHASLGIHRSFRGDLSAEHQDLPEAIANRHHFLDFRLPDLFDEVEASGIKLDCSLGYSSHMGYRNSYGLPFKPWNVKERRSYNFIELPIHIMDSTWQHYQKQNAAQAQLDITKFLSRQGRGQIISVLWHNNSYTEGYYKSWKEPYLAVLELAERLHLSALSIEDVVEELT
jgi:hypothetical protein